MKWSRSLDNKPLTMVNLNYYQNNSNTKVAHLPLIHNDRNLCYYYNQDGEVTNVTYISEISMNNYNTNQGWNQCVMVKENEQLK
jgi:hypothetical protein